MDRYGHLFDQSYADASEAIERAFELPSAEEAAAASVPPPSTVPAVPSRAASAQPAAVIPLDHRQDAAAVGTG